MDHEGVGFWVSVFRYSNDYVYINHPNNISVLDDSLEEFVVAEGLTYDEALALVLSMGGIRNWETSDVEGFYCI